MLIPIVLMAAAVPQAAELAVVAPEPSERGTLAFPAGFFAETQPTSAYDMVIRVPGFTFDKGASVRGLLESAARGVGRGVGNGGVYAVQATVQGGGART